MNTRSDAPHVLRTLPAPRVPVVQMYPPRRGRGRLAAHTVTAVTAAAVALGGGVLGRDIVNTLSPDMAPIGLGDSHNIKFSIVPTHQGQFRAVVEETGANLRDYSLVAISGDNTQYLGRNTTSVPWNGQSVTLAVVADVETVGVDGPLASPVAITITGRGVDDPQIDVVQWDTTNPAAIPTPTDTSTLGLG